MTETATIVLAAGKGTRMKSELPKVLHQAAGRSLLSHVLHAAAELKPARTVVVAGPGMDDVASAARQIIPGALLAVQAERLGTAHAVAAAKPSLAGFSGVVIILYGDVPLIETATLKRLVDQTGAQAMAVLGFEAADPHGYGRLLQGSPGEVRAIREELDASFEEKRINICNSGVIAISSELLWQLLPRIGNANAKSEYYLTDMVELAVAGGHSCRLVLCPETEVAGVNDRVQLASIELQLQRRYRRHHMLNGATLVDPDTVHFAADTRVGRDVVIEPQVYFGPGVTVGDGVTIHGFSHIEGASIAAGAKIGPYARLRPGAEIGEDAHIGNFVEVKKAVIGKGAKANHLSYIGDASVGTRSNIGAGTITCNYDGFDKYRTEIGANVFVGSNTALVAPVRIGDGASIGAGSVITCDVPADALGLTRPDQEIRQGWAARYRKIKQSQKAAKKV